MERRSSWIIVLWAMLLPGLLAIGGYARAQTSVVNRAQLSPPAGWTCPGGGDCTRTAEVTNPVGSPQLSLSKTASPGPFAVGGTGTFTLVVGNNGNLPTAGTITIVDPMPAGLEATAASGSGWDCSVAPAAVSCSTAAVLAAGAQSAPITIQVNVLAAAFPQVSNIARVGGGGDLRCQVESSHDEGCIGQVTRQVVDPRVTVAKQSNPASGSSVERGQAIGYTLTATVSQSATTQPVVLTDTLAAGLGFASVPSGCSTSGQVMQCTLPAGSAVGTHSFNYTAIVAADATGSVSNAVTGANGCTPGASCTTTHPVVLPTVGVSKSTTAAGPVEVGDVLDYTLTVTVADADTLVDVVLTDALGSGLELVSGSVAGTGFTIGSTGASGFSATLPAGTAPGIWTLTYQATVTAAASMAVGNTVTPTGAPCVGSCSTSTPVARPGIALGKTALAPRTPAQVNDEISYTLSVVVTDARTIDPVVITDTLGTGLELVAGSITAGAFSCNAANPLVCTLPAGTAPGTWTVGYKARVTTAASGSVSNSVTGAPCATQTCTTTTPVAQPSVGVSKSTTATGAVEVGDVLDYSLTVVVADADTLVDVVLTDTLGTGLELVSGSVAGTGFTIGSTGASGFSATLPAGTAPGTWTLTYQATVTAAAGMAVGNTVTPTGAPCAGSCSTSTPVARPGIALGKTAQAPRTPAQVNDEISYTLSVVVTDARTIDPMVITDTLGTGLELVAGSITAGAFSCNAANPLMCTLPAGTAPGTWTVGYNARVTTAATGSVSNSVTGAPCATQTCTTTTPVAQPSVGVSKSTTAAGAVEVGEVLDYTLTVTVADADTLVDVVLTDTLGTGLELVSGSVAGNGFTIGSTGASGFSATLPAGTAPGTWTLTYQATVTAAAGNAVGNTVTPTGAPCAGSCSTQTPVARAAVDVTKTVDATAAVLPGQTLTYSITVTVGLAALSEPLTLVDTLGAGLVFGQVIDAGAFQCTGSLSCVLPAGTAQGRHVLRYTATVAANASGVLRNVVTAGNPPGGDPDPTCSSCSTETPVVESVARVNKSVARTEAVRPGDVLDYTLVLTIENAANPGEISLVDTLGDGLEFIGVTDAGPFTCERALTCVLPAGNLPGQYRVVYQARVLANAGAEVRNSVVAIQQDPESATPSLPGEEGQPLCETCTTVTPVARDVQLRLSKVAAVRQARIGDLVRYTLQVDNIGDADLVNGTIVDSAPAGFSLVAGSLVVVDGDNAAIAGGSAPVRFEGIDIRAGGSAQLVYLMRVGAGVRNGVQVNRAQLRDSAGNPVSNEASAQVIVGGDPLLEESLLLGTVFDDRDGDGWQDSAGLDDVRVQGGFAPSAYIAGSSSIERGGQREPLADASSPLLHGVLVGRLAGRSSEADDGQAGTVVIRQRLREPAFDDGFVLRSRQGVEVRMAADGSTTTTARGEAARGLSAARIEVRREVSALADGYEVAYVIGNSGIDERGIPGVRIASVEGLLMETDQFGRYHLVGISAGELSRGRNHVLKVDPATLPEGSRFTTDNPLLRRITPGMPTRFDFGVQLPQQRVGGGRQQAELELGEVLFAPGSAQLKPHHQATLQSMVATLERYQGGELVIAADGEAQPLALARAQAVADALQQLLPAALRERVSVQVRSEVADPASTVAGARGEAQLLGTVLFDTDSAAIRPAYAGVLDAVAARLQQRGGGTVAIIGHTDRRGSHGYNTALGLRRAQAVHEALMSRLDEAVRPRVRVDASSNTQAPVDAGSE